MVIGIDGHPIHAAEVDDDAGAQRATSPIVSAAAHRQWKTVITCDANGQLDVFSRPAVNDGSRHAAHWLRPDRGRGGIAALGRAIAGQASRVLARFDQASLYLRVWRCVRGGARCDRDLGKESKRS